jgi:hypothetical protein
MEEFHKEDLEKVRVQFLAYLSYLLNNTPKKPTNWWVFYYRYFNCLILILGILTVA